MWLFKKNKYYISVCCIVKDENNYIREWVDYHRMIGVEKFYIYDNESNPPVASIVQDLVDSNVITVLSFPGKTMQMRAYNHCIENYGMESKWIAFIDLDEFIVPKATNGDLQRFLHEYEGYGGVGINWMVFGSNGYTCKTDNSQISRFTHRSAASAPINTHIKSIVQPRYVKPKAENPHFFYYKKGKFCVNENYEKISGPFSPNSTDKVQLNHYSCRSLEEYKEKIMRGRADVDVMRCIEDFYEHDKEANEVEDLFIQKIWPKAEL